MVLERRQYWLTHWCLHRRRVVLVEGPGTARVLQRLQTDAAACVCARCEGTEAAAPRDHWTEVYE